MGSEVLYGVWNKSDDLKKKIHLKSGIIQIKRL